MPLDLPQPEHVVYNSQHLSRVVSQLRFDPVLKIAAQDPWEFQEAIRASFPLLEPRRSPEFRVSVVQQSPPEVAERIDWRFVSTDRKRTVTLSSDFLAYEVAQYEDFNDFQAAFAPVRDALVGIYAVPEFTRVGLRYRNAFGSDAGVPADVLNPFMIGLLGSPLAPNISQWRSEYVLEAEHRIGIRLELTRPRARPTAIGSAGEGDRTLFLDIDHFVAERRLAEDVAGLLEQFHATNYQLFRWSITPALHERMDPRQ